MKLKLEGLLNLLLIKVISPVKQKPLRKLLLPTKSINSITQQLGIYQKDEGESVNVRGSRSDATSYIVDGIKVRGTMGVPTSAIEQITVVTGGLLLNMEITGGVIEVTTKGPSNKLFGSIEFESSRLFDVIIMIYWVLHFWSYI